MNDFPFKTKPYQHQLDIFEDSKDKEYCALFMEMRTGKSKTTLDTAAYQFRQGRIDALLIISPNGVSRGWLEEISTHLHDSTNYKCVLWRSGRMATKTASITLEELLKHPGLAILSVNVDALITDTLKKYLAKFFLKRKVFSVIDESIDISSPGAARTKTAMRVGARSVTRRILDGTPVAAAPLGLYSQCAFLKPGLLGNSYMSFKTRYAEWETKDVGERDKPCTDCGGNGVKIDTSGEYQTCQRCHGNCFIGRNSFQSLKGYQRLDELTEKLGEFSYRVRRDQCADLPQKVYKKRFFTLTNHQQRAYTALRDEFVAELAAGVTLTATMALTRLLRLQQITSNFAPIEGALAVCPQCNGDGCEACQDQGVVGSATRLAAIDPAHNPRLDALLAVLAPLEGQGIIWCRFRHDVDAVFGALENVVRYDGSMHAEARAMALREFQTGDARYIVGTAQAGGRGLDLAMADHVVYYSHSWSLRQRLQSEDRAQSLKKTDAVLYVDLIADGSVDEKIIAALRAGRDLSATILGDPHVFD